jgi:hypothetical protein
MRNSMGKTNLRIINDLKIFMDQICDDNSLKANYTYGERDLKIQPAYLMNFRNSFVVI